MSANEALVFAVPMPADYKVASGDSMQVLEYEVGQLTRDGWKMQGGISVVAANTDTSFMYHQAMWRERRYDDFRQGVLREACIAFQVTRERTT